MLAHHRTSELLSKRTGVFIAPERHGHLDYCLRAACRDTGFTEIDSYLAALEQSVVSQPVWQRLLHHLAIGETYFFRDSDSLRERILPSLIARRRADESFTLRIWSAGCATGEEVYTLAMLLRDLLPDIERWKITIIGTDINEWALAAAERGRYGAWSVRGMLPLNAMSYLKRDGEFWQVADTIREMVTFRVMNLVEDSAPLVNADLVVCRNVLLYISRERRAQVLNCLKSALAPGGELLLGDNDAAIQQVVRPARRTETNLRPVVVANLTNLTKSAPDEPIAKAQQAADREHWDEAHTWLDEAQAQNRLNLPVHFLRALVYEGQGKIPDAIQSLRRCLYLDHNFALAHYTLGNLYARRGQREQAVQYWANAVALLNQQPGQQVLPLADGLTVSDVLALIRSQSAEIAS